MHASHLCSCSYFLARESGHYGFNLCHGSFFSYFLIAMDAVVVCCIFWVDANSSRFAHKILYLTVLPTEDVNLFKGSNCAHSYLPNNLCMENDLSAPLFLTCNCDQKTNILNEAAALLYKYGLHSTC